MRDWMHIAGGRRGPRSTGGGGGFLQEIATAGRPKRCLVTAALLLVRPGITPPVLDFDSLVHLPPCSRAVLKSCSELPLC